MEFVQQRWNPAKTQCSQRNFGQKTPLKPKKIICVDLPIFRLDNYQNATNDFCKILRQSWQKRSIRMENIFLFFCKNELISVLKKLQTS